MLHNLLAKINGKFLIIFAGIVILIAIILLVVAFVL